MEDKEERTDEVDVDVRLRPRLSAHRPFSSVASAPAALSPFGVAKRAAGAGSRVHTFRCAAGAF